MDIQVYEDILGGLVAYNDNLAENYGNLVVPTSPTEPTYPLTVFEEIRNIPMRSYNTCYDRVASIGYRVDIYAKSKGDITKQTIARRLAKDIDSYLTNNVGLTQVSWNVSELENDSSVYHIIMTYVADLHENRRRIL